MIGMLRGRVACEEPNGFILDVNGVGYEVASPVGTLAKATSKSGEVSIFVHTHVREEALDLYGFASELERRVFRLLLGVPNVGPKTALVVMSALPPPELARAVHASDMGRLGKVPGIGKKTAERLVLELKEKLPKLTVEPVAEERGAAARPDAAKKLLLALTTMGYRPAEAERAVAALGDRITAEPMEQLLREALNRLTA